MTRKRKPPRVVILHRTKDDKRVKVRCGAAYSRPSRRPKPRARVGQQALRMNVDQLFEKSLSAEARQLCALEPARAGAMLTALRLTELGFSRSIVPVEDDAGVWLACAWPYRRWTMPKRISWSAPESLTPQRL